MLKTKKEEEYWKCTKTPNWKYYGRRLVPNTRRTDNFTYSKVIGNDSNAKNWVLCELKPTRKGFWHRIVVVMKIRFPTITQRGNHSEYS